MKVYLKNNSLNIIIKQEDIHDLQQFKDSIVLYTNTKQPLVYKRPNMEISSILEG